jgi:hypothetical protein
MKTFDNFIILKNKNKKGITFNFEKKAFLIKNISTINTVLADKILFIKLLL